MKLVVDTNLLLSGTLWAGNPSRLVDALLEGAATLCLSSDVLAELEEVIQREKFQKLLVQKGRTPREICRPIKPAHADNRAYACLKPFQALRALAS